MWFRSGFSSKLKCDLVIDNVPESFNKYLRQAKEKPVITMLETIRKQLMRRLQKKKEKMSAYEDPICPKIMKKWDKLDSISKYCTLDYAGESKWECSYKESTFVVDLGNKTCGCRKWDVSGILCIHALAAIKRTICEKKKLCILICRETPAWRPMHTWFLLFQIHDNGQTQ